MAQHGATSVRQIGDGTVFSDLVTAVLPLTNEVTPELLELGDVAGRSRYAQENVQESDAIQGG